MPGARSTVKPAPASDFSASDEASQLDHHLQQQLEEDVARIFDESIYSDLEVVCGKLKILTHSCILKARTNNFYHKLDSILHTNLGRKTFDEIYSFISDAYTECNIKHQEKEIITYLDDNLNVVKTVLNKTLKPKEDFEEQEVFLTPKCATPYVENKFEKSITTSPSTDLTKEYYALVPIEGNLLEKELIEQDALSTAFHSLVKSQSEDITNEKATPSQRNKPTSLPLCSSHSLKTVKHSSSCDILDNHTKDNSDPSAKSIFPVNKKIIESFEINHTIPAEHTGDINDLRSEITSNKIFDSVYSPDSLITDEPSSSSDYLSAAYTCSPGVSSAAYIPQLNVGKNISKMENIFTSSDSGLENTGLLESLGSHKDVTLTDVSLTESTLHDLTTDDTNDSVSSSLADRNQIHKIKHSTWSSISGTSSDKDVNGTITQSSKPKDTPSKSSKEEKQRQNEEIVILESSSLSSETGSWESVFPPKIAEKEICEKFICNERQNSNNDDTKYKVTANFREDINHSLVQKSPFKSTSCFIDAASLVDEEDDTIQVQTDTNEFSENVRSDTFPAPSRPVPCSTARTDISPNDWSENNENDDSLEQPDKDPDSIQKDLSPTIFEMTPITEDSLCGNSFENAAIAELKKSEEDSKQVDTKPFSQCTNTVFVSNTPHNSIMSLKATNLKQYESEESESDTTFVGRESQANIKFTKFNECSPIVSGGASIEDHLPSMTSQTASPLSRRKIENIPIVSGAYIPPVEDSRKSPKLSSSSAWVVDMSSATKSDVERIISTTNNTGVKKPGDRTCESLKNGSKSSLESCHSENFNKSRNSMDSDSSEKSSHKFYIDLSNLPAPETSDQLKDSDSNREKKNIFSMYIDLGEKPTVKEMPARLSSSLNARKSAVETKSMSKSYKSNKTPSDVSSAVSSRTNDNVPGASNLQPKCKGNSVNNAIESSETIRSPKQSSVKSDSTVIVKDRPVPPETMTYDKHARKLDADRSSRRSVSVPIQEEPKKETASDLFVKLSDLDKPVQKNETMTISEGKVLDVRMTRSIPENNWGNQSNTVASKSIEVISSFHSENALSLNRLFPHLQNEFSRSMPGSLSSRTKSPMRVGTATAPGELEEQASDMSEVSSVQSSMCRSVVENSTTEETSQMSSLIGNCQSRLGQDLLRMFLEEIAPDVIVEVSGRRIKAHKCILSSRCQYFAGILSGGWVESAGNVIVLPPFSFNVVHFALCHIYSGLSTIPDTISIVELATIADMLGLEGLKEAIMFTLKAKYCHHFHRPCQVCTAGVLECFPLSAVYGLDDLYRKCLRWITKHFPKVWPTKAFATLPKELLDKCYQQHMINLTVENLVDTVYGCGITVASLQNSRWSESVSRMCRRLVNAVAHFAATRLVRVLGACAGLAPDAPDPARQALDDCFAAAIQWAPPDEACRAYAFLCALINELRLQLAKKPRPQENLLTAHAYSWRMQCEGALVRSAPRVVNTQAFKELPLDLRKRLRELGCIMFGTQALPVTASPQQERKTRSTYQSPKYKTPTASNRNFDIDQVRNSFVPYVPKPAAPIGSIDLMRSDNDLRDKKIKSQNPPKIRTTKAQQERAKFNLLKNNQSQDRLSTKTTNSIRISFENTKPRYLEPKVVKDGERKLTVANNKLVPKMVSSSESSRNSSPVQARASRVRPQDSILVSSRPRTAEPSTDSLSESQNSNKYATYTKAKHTTKGSIESVNSSRYQNGQTTNNKLKTKIPVYQATKPNRENCRQEKPNGGKKNVNANDIIKVSSPGAAKKMSGSLMNATKSSSAKMVPKILKEQQANKTSTPKQVRKASSNVTKHSPQEKTPDIPVMERSGTFLKDEPTFGDKTTNIDIDQ